MSDKVTQDVKRKRARTKTVCVRLHEDDYDFLKMIADLNGTTVSEVLRDTVRIMKMNFALNRMLSMMFPPIFQSEESGG